MSDEAKMAQEVAKLGQELARLGAKGLDVSEKLAGFFAKILDGSIEEITGMLNDKLRFIRWKRLVKIKDGVETILTEKGVKEIRTVMPKIALPIMEEASLEDEPELQSLWEHLLANAMNPDFNDEIRYGFIDMIKNITAIEARLMHVFYEIEKGSNHLEPLAEVYNHVLHKGQVMTILKINENRYALSVNNLVRMQLVSPATFKNIGIFLGAESIYKGIEAITLTPLGVKFVEACMK